MRGELGQEIEPRPKFRLGKVYPLPGSDPRPPPVPNPVPRPFPRPPVMPDRDVPLICGLGLETIEEYRIHAMKITRTSTRTCTFRYTKYVSKLVFLNLSRFQVLTSLIN